MAGALARGQITIETDKLEQSRAIRRIDGAVETDVPPRQAFPNRRSCARAHPTFIASMRAGEPAHFRHRNRGFLVAGHIEGGVQLSVIDPLEQAGRRRRRLGARIFPPAPRSPRLGPIRNRARSEPRGEWPLVSMRPLAEKRRRRGQRPPTVDLHPVPSTFARALALRAMKPAMVARPISTAIVMSCGRSIAEPAISALPKESAASISSSARIERGIELGCPAAGRERISKAAGDGFAVERSFKPVGSEPVAGEREIAAQTQWPQVALRHIGAPFQPGHQHFRISGIDLSRPGEADGVFADGKMPAQPHLRIARRTKLEAVQIPSACAGADVAAQVRNGVAAERDLVDADADLDRNSRTEGAAGQFGDLADGGGRRRTCRRRRRARGRDRSGGPTARRRSAAACRI